METATEDLPKTPNTRTPKAAKAEKSADSAPTSRVKPFPAPPKSTIKHGTIPPEKFWAYRKSLPEEFHDRLTFFVYREWPKLDFYKNLSADELAEIRAKRMSRPIKYIAKYGDIDPDDWRNHLLRFHGSGVYKLMLNDAGVRGDKEFGRSSNICSTTVELRDDEFSPVVDISVLDMNDPSNAAFINDLRMKGFLPGAKEEGEDMAATVAVEKLTDALVEQTKLKAPDNSAAIMLSDLLRQSEERHLKQQEIAEARHIRDMEAINKRLESAEATAKIPANTTTQDVIAMAKTLVPPPSPPADSGMVALLTQMLASADKRLESEKAQRIEELKMQDARHAREMDAVNKRLEAQENRAIELEKARLQQAQVAPGKSAIKDAVDMFRALRGATDELSGDGPVGTGNPWVDLASEHLPKVLDTIGNITTALRTPAPTPQGSAVPGQQQAVQAQQQEVSEVAQMAAYARMIHGPLIQALSSGTPGHRFAATIITQYPNGDGAYHFLCEQGENGVMRILQSAPEVWADVQKNGAKFPQFLAEFLNAPLAIETAEAIRAGARPMQQPQPPPAGRPANQPRAAVVVDASPAEGGRTVIGPDGQPVKTRPPNGGVAI